ncbi:MAG: DUF1257 domain-containing protein [Deltaproteobacteria bacterium]|nr:MAG: DUF1257 domain-containing protein [Deltaproteobacteria bacterium]
MSKIVTIQTEFRDGVVLKDTLESLGYRVEEEGENALSARKGRATLLTFRRRSSGTFETLVDIERSHNDTLDEIKQRYAMLKILEETEKAGFSCVKQEVDGERNLKLVVRKWQAA